MNKLIMSRYLSGREVTVQLRNAGQKSVTSADTGHKNKVAFEFNAERDKIYSNQDTFCHKGVLTMFTQQWIGIRHACGALSGHKIAVNGRHSFAPYEVEQLANFIKKNDIERVVYHGMANSTSSLIRGLKTLLPNVRFFGVWHGTMAGWSSDEEVELFKLFLSLATDRIFEKIGFLRQGMQALHSRAYSKILYNIPPKVNVRRLESSFEQNPFTCLFASWNNSWKNMYTNLLGAQNAKCIGKILVYSQPKLPIFNKVEAVDFINHTAHLHRLARIDLCLNVSINDCQPMTELEGLSVGTPSIRNDWNLDLEGNGEYERTFTVQSYLNAGKITDYIEKIAEIPYLEIDRMVTAHKSALLNASRRRYSEFLA